jgi:uncharacterized iron-regulated membrane protein
VTDTFFRRVWRWHFWAGLISAPVLLAVAVTGAIYTFRDEIDEINRPALHFVEPGGEGRTADELLAAVRASHPETKPVRLTVPADPRRSVTAQTADGRAVYLNPYTTGELGEGPAKSPFFTAVLTLHRNLFAGTFGRVVVELATSWTVVLLVSGAVLWWPKNWRQVWGVWLPRLWGPKYRILRDLHAVPAAYLTPIAAVLAVTGLFFSVVWLWGYNTVTGGQGDFPAVLRSPGVSPAESHGPVSVDRVVTLARDRWPGHTLSVQLPRSNGDSLAVTARTVRANAVAGMVAISPHTGEIVADVRAEYLPPLQQARLWMFPVHTGAVWGLPTKVLAFVTAVLMTGLAISGVAMWLVRRPAGWWGLPRASVAPVPKAAVVTILVLVALFPTVALSLLVVLLGEWLIERFYRRPAHPVSMSVNLIAVVSVPLTLAGITE